MFRHGADLNALKNTNLGGALMVQGEEENENTFWFLKGRLRRQEGTRQLRVECNYDGHNWIYNLFNTQKIGKLIITNTFDNEDNLPSDYIPGLKKLPKKLQDRYLYGSDTEMEGLVYDEFSEGRHVVEPFLIPDGWKKDLCLDHGLRNPTAVLWYAVDYDGNIVIYDEHYEAGKPVSYHSGEIKRRGILKGLCDPSLFNKNQSRGDYIYSIADEYRDYGINLIAAYRSQEEATINRVNEWFKADRIKIFKNCVHTIDEVSSWKWKALKPGVIRNDPEEPEDYRNHCCDDLKYIIASRCAASVIPEKKPDPDSLEFHLRQQEMKEKDWRSKYDNRRLS